MDFELRFLPYLSKDKLPVESISLCIGSDYIIIFRYRYFQVKADIILIFFFENEVISEPEMLLIFIGKLALFVSYPFTIVPYPRLVRNTTAKT